MNILETIKKVWMENFLRELTNEEAEKKLIELVNCSSEEFSKLPGYNRAILERYVRNITSIAFSPNAINDEIKKVVERIGIEELETSTKYKRLSEMNDAVCLAIALKKITGKEWMIKPQDAPDILLIRTNGESMERKFILAAPLEIMQIRQQEKDGFGSAVEEGMVKFIVEKKFNKRFEPETILLVHMNFDHIGLNIKKISELMCFQKDNPYHQIWVRGNTDPSFMRMGMFMIYPQFGEIKIDFNTDRDLYY